jgi:hypothetical protein
MSTAAHRSVVASSRPFEPCTCGEAHPHEVMRRTTADGVSIHLESDGKVLGLMGRSLRDVPVRRPRTAESHRLALKAGRLFMNAVGFYSANEIGKLYADACEAARRGVEIRDVQRERENAPPEAPPLAWTTTPLAWTTTRADARGNPTERQARLPRLLWPGMSVVDYCGGPGSKNGRYVLLHRSFVDGREVWSEAHAFRNLADLWVFLRS